jgi:arginyl-tRNA synthetase
MHFEEIVGTHVIAGLAEIYSIQATSGQLTFQPTRKEFEGDLTLVVFPLAKLSGQPPEQTGNAIGAYLLEHCQVIRSFNLVKGFLNLVIKDAEWMELFKNAVSDKTYGINTRARSDEPVLVEYSSPNTNKPLHLGHVRNNLLGYSVSEILKASGNPVRKVNIVNDRGIHICKSMIAWQQFGQHETPEITGMKGDHFVGKYYVEFDKQYRMQVADLVASGKAKEEAEKVAPLMMQTQEMLRQWEAGDPAVLSLWKKMNGWVYDGFDETYRMMGVDFDKLYYESDTYLLGKKIVEEGLSKGIFYKKPDGSVWIDLTDEGFDQKLFLRSDGTTVYMTQDLGTALLRYEEFGFSRMIFVVANEQDYHFKVLKIVLKKLGYAWWDRLYHLNYGMVDLPSGKMKSREGTVVDADELMKEMVDTARKLTMELGKIEGFTPTEAEKLFHTIGMGALKYFILKVDPDKRMLFNPAESIDFNGNTGPFIQYTHARIRSVLRKAAEIKDLTGFEQVDVKLYETLPVKEKELMKIILRFPEALEEAASRYSPAVIANYSYELAKSYNQFFHEHLILDQQNPDTGRFRLALSFQCGKIISSAMSLLGITAPERM